MRTLHLLAVLFICFSQSCTKNDGPAAAEGQLPAYILSHTGGVIGRASQIVVTFDSTVVTLPGKQARISFDPSITGDSRLTGRRLVFQPSEPLPPGNNYRATVSVPGRSDYTFTFTVPERRLALESDGYYIPDPDRPESVELNGLLVTNDGASAAEIAEVLTVTHAGRPLQVNIDQQSPNIFSYSATIADRGAKSSTAIIAYNGDRGAFAGAKGETAVTIAPTGSFEFLRIDPAAAGGELVARFTGPVAGNQDLTGIIRFDPVIPFTTAIDGNLIRVFPTSGEIREAKLLIDTQLKSNEGKPLAQSVNWNVTLGGREPALRAVSSGSIMPHEGQRLYTFEAIGLEAVYLEIFRIDGGNVLQFLQDEPLGSVSQQWSLRRVGHLVSRSVVPLDQLAALNNQHQWSRYAIDLDRFIDNDGASIYQVSLGFGMEHTIQSCRGRRIELGLTTVEEMLTSRVGWQPGFADVHSLIADYSGLYGYEFWDDRDDPCSPAYYHRDRYLRQNVLSSNLGLIAKRNPDRSTIAFATNLLTGGPQDGVTVIAYTYDQREIFSGITDDEGRVRMETDEEPAFLIARQDEETAYLTLAESDALPLSRFDVGGQTAAAGMNGAFFAERGVWRPGDSVFLHFVLEDRDDRLPAQYPVEFTLEDARGRTVERRTVMPFGESYLYPLKFSTSRTDETGNWRATVRAGGRSYSRALLIETVKPNRLAIDLSKRDGGRIILAADWLYGAPGSGLRAEVSYRPAERSVSFSDFTGFVFGDPARPIEAGEEVQVFSGSLDAKGEREINPPATAKNSPGPMLYRLNTKVFEPGGNFSVDHTTLPYDPYPVYAGLSLPADEWGNKSISREGNSKVALASVDTAGKGVANRKLTIGLYRVDYRYWWQDGNDNVARFSSNQHAEALSVVTATTDKNGRAILPLSVDRWGRYLLRVCDEGGHCAGDYFYADYGDRGDTDRQSAALLRLRAEEESVATGQQVSIKVPTSQGGQLLVSLETSNGSVEQFWVQAAAGETKVTFRTDERMIPTVYANISYLQPYAQTTNDRPVRLFGVVPVEVVSPTTALSPEITVSDEWQPKQRVEVRVREAGDRPMTYVLAVVDEGLLGLTRFKTPDLHDDFFAKQSLAVKTYDLYDNVMSSINGEFGKVLAIGGDGTEVDPEAASANRFEAVVRHLGPFTLNGGTASHDIDLPNYIGAVRVMVVAVGERAYGSDEVSVPVRQPLMVLPTLPRVLGPGESVEMPVNVMRMEDGRSDVTVSVSESENLVRIPTPRNELSFTGAGERLTFFPISVGDRTGIARFEVSGRGSGASSSQEIEIDVRQQNSTENRSTLMSIAPGESKRVEYTPFGLPDTQEATLELSGLLAMNVTRHLAYLLNYPYGCAEQTISAAFAQLYLDRLTALSPGMEAERKRNVVLGISSIRKFRSGSGGISYWPGVQRVHPWATNYALHFLIRAEEAGFAVPADLKRDLTDFQESAARSWTRTDGAFYASFRQRSLDQAYRLYTLALAGRADVGAMNRLRGIGGSLETTARFQLAAAYAMVGQQKAAAELINGVDPEVQAYRELGYTFGSELRDMAIILEAYQEIGDRAATDVQALRLATAVGKRKWLSTQEAAFALVGIGKLTAGTSATTSATFTSPTGTASTVGGSNGVTAIELPLNGSRTFGVENTGQSPLYLSIVTSGVPAAGEESVSSQNLRLSVAYTDLNGKSIDVGSLTSGTDFMATYTVGNPGATGQDYRQMALASILPSGWEIGNRRLAGRDTAETDAFEYQDIRDDRVNTFFDLPAGSSKTFRFRLTATYPGRYYLPAQSSEAMYDHDIRASVAGRWVTVKRGN